MSRRTASHLASVAMVVLLAACGSDPVEPSPAIAASPSPAISSEPSPTTAPESPSADGLTVVALGDSIPFNSPGDCPGCTGFVDSYAAALGEDLDRPVAVVNRSRHDGARTIDILRQLKSDDDLVAQLGTADVVIISVASNDQPPFVDPHDGCPPAVGPSASDSEAFEAAAQTSPSCIDSVVPVILDQVTEVSARVRAAARDAAIVVLTPYDSWRGWPGLDGLDATTLSRLLDAETYWFQTWNPVLCEAAEKIDAVCLDVYGAFNGADGTDAADEYVADDYTHPSQKGNDRIRDLLLDALPADQLAR